MKLDWLEAGVNLYEPGETMECLIIILDGEVTLKTVMDDEIPVVLERLGRGCILGANTFLVSDQTEVTATCTMPTRIFAIERSRFTQIVQRDKKLFKELLKI